MSQQWGKFFSLDNTTLAWIDDKHKFNNRKLGSRCLLSYRQVQHFHSNSYIQYIYIKCIKRKSAVTFTSVYRIIYYHYTISIFLQISRTITKLTLKINYGCLLASINLSTLLNNTIFILSKNYMTTLTVPVLEFFFLPLI